MVYKIEAFPCDEYLSLRDEIKSANSSGVMSLKAPHSLSARKIKNTFIRPERVRIVPGLFWSSLITVSYLLRIS